ncbi:MAG: hypothetical protein NC340_10620 [Ruminococcus flavefaciens]|nr:hypothetical protein [Ruminococcus flavefaciens]MCM1234317.1 hypothetical protein [Ruminococcus flavefaciens]
MKNTDDLLRDLKSAESIDDYIDSNRTYFAEIPLADYLKKLLAEKNLRQADVIRNAEIDTVYGCQIFSGARKNPARDKVLAIVLAMKLSLDETQQLLKICGLPFLYSKHKRDSIIIFAINKELSVVEANNLLYAQDEKTLG